MIRAVEPVLTIADRIELAVQNAKRAAHHTGAQTVSEAEASADVVPIGIEAQAASIPDLHRTCPGFPADGVAERQFAGKPPMISGIGGQFPVAEGAIDVPEADRITGWSPQAQVRDRVTSKVVAEI